MNARHWRHRDRYATRSASSIDRAYWAAVQRRRMAEIGPTAHRARLLAILRLQRPDVPAGDGFRLLHPETGDRYGDRRRHLVTTCRSVADFPAGVLVDGPSWRRAAAGGGVAFLREAHRDDDGGHHLVVAEGGASMDRTRSAYGHAFVLLAYARATAAGGRRRRGRSPTNRGSPRGAFSRRHRSSPKRPGPGVERTGAVSRPEREHARP